MEKVDWIVRANASMAEIYIAPVTKDMTTGESGIQLLEKFEHPEGRMKGRAFATDDFGHYQGYGGSAGKFADPTDPKAVELDSFAKKIANALEHGRVANAYDKVAIVAAPHFYGLITKHLTNHVKGLVLHVPHKDGTYFDQEELYSIVQNALIKDRRDNYE